MAIPEWKVSKWLTGALPPGGSALAWVIFLLIAVAMFFDPGRETMAVSGSALAFCLALASIAFSYARLYDDKSAVRDEVTFAGEILLHAAVMFLSASLFKYASADVPRYLLALADPDEQEQARLGAFGFRWVLAAFAFFSFFGGLLRAQYGLRILMAVAAVRAERRTDDRTGRFSSTNDIATRVRDLERSDEARASASKRPPAAQ